MRLLKRYVHNKLGNIAPKGLVLFLHGYGSNGEDLISLAPEIEVNNPNLIYVSFDATFAWEGGYDRSFQWYSLADRKPEVMAEAAQQGYNILAYNIEKLLEDYQLNFNQLIIAGFSQGGMMTLHSPCYLTQKPRGLISFSGYMIPTGYHNNFALDKLPILITHGELDDVVEREKSLMAAEFLKAKGADVSTHFVNNLSHGIDYSCIHSASAFVKSLF